MAIDAPFSLDVREAPPQQAYLNRRDAATRCRVPLSTFDWLRKQRRFPSPDAEMGKHMLWKVSTIDAFLDAGGTRGSAQ